MQGTFDSNAPNMPAVKATGTAGANAVEATTDNGTAVQAFSNKFGVVGSTTRGAGVTAIASDTGIALRADAKSGNAVNAQSVDAIGILGTSESNVGIQGVCHAGYSYGVVGIGANAGVAAFNPNNSHAAYLASDSVAAWLTGDVHVSGKLWKGSGGFTIDHPGDPANLLLSHSFVESAEMKNLYDGIVETDANGQAEVVLPDWFELLNEDFRYQLCPIGAASPNLHVSQELSAGRVRIAGASPNSRVSWQITGVRRDNWAKANPLQVEEPKQKAERGLYLHPHLFGANAENSIGHARHRPRRKLPSE